MRAHWFEQYKVDIPEGRSGDWEVTRFVVDEEASKWASLRAMINKDSRGSLPPGTYTKLTYQHSLIMSDTPDEIYDHIEPITRAEGICRVHGLGLGLVVAAMLKRPTVDRVDVVEISEDVIRLVAPTLFERYGNERLRVIQGDVFELKPKPGEAYEVVWHDVWDTLRYENLPEMTKLHRRWARRTLWQGSWGKSFLLRQRRLYGYDR